MNEWLTELVELAAADEPVVVVTVAAIRGSAPREIGAKMIVSRTETVGTIGGGQLEYECARIAFGMLDDGERLAMRTYPLGASMGQCCGGVVDILFEPLPSGMPVWLVALEASYAGREPAVVVTCLDEPFGKCVVTANETVCPPGRALPGRITDRARRLLEDRAPALREGAHLFEPVVGSDFDVAVFGAGHVGSAVVQLLSTLDCKIRWIDSRRNVFGPTPANVCAIESADPALEVSALPPGSCYLVMTHSHALDFDICERILRRRDVAYCGLIGSRSKRRRFEKRYRALGMPPELLEQLVCPIGVAGIRGKKPAEIAVSAAAQVLRAYEQSRRQSGTDYPDMVQPIRR